MSAVCVLTLLVGAVVTVPAQARAPAGAACKPSREHPTPVLLLHGTLGVANVTWARVRPALTRRRFCVFALQYNNRGMADIRVSAREVAAYGRWILRETGARRLSLVGHSQGGMLGRWMVRFVAKAPPLEDVVALAPTSHGVSGPQLDYPSCIACEQQWHRSPFMRKLNQGDQTPGPASYTVIATSYDTAVTPVRSQFLGRTGRSLTNVLLQAKCPGDRADHLTIPFDPVAFSWIANALDRDGPASPSFRPRCTGTAANQ